MWLLPFNLKSVAYSLTFLKAYSRTKFKSRGHSDSPCFWPQVIGKTLEKIIYTDSAIGFAETS